MLRYVWVYVCVVCVGEGGRERVDGDGGSCRWGERGLVGSAVT